MHHSPRIHIIGNDAVHETVIVPDDEIALLPFVAVREGRLGRTFLEAYQQRTAVGNWRPTTLSA